MQVRMHRSIGILYASNACTENNWINLAYRASDIPAEECRLNKEMLRAAVQSIESVSSKLSFVTLITGTKVCLLAETSILTTS